MTETKSLSRKTFVWSHVGAIAFHALLACLVLWVGIVALRAGSGSLPRSHTLVLVIVGAILLLFSLLSLWPILIKRRYAISGSSTLRRGANK